jgi:hypothetical protein
VKETMTMKTQHMSARTLRRMLPKTIRRERRAEDRWEETEPAESTLLAVTPKTRTGRLFDRARNRRWHVAVALKRCPVVLPENLWTLKPGQVIAALKEEKGIGPSFAARVTKHSRAMRAAAADLGSVERYLARVNRRFDAGAETSANVDKAQRLRDDALNVWVRLREQPPERPGKQFGVAY